MKDFDFEELDRAVSGVLNGSEPQKNEPVAPAPITPAASMPAPSSAPAPSPVASVSLPTPDKPTVDSVAPAARRSSGRFMDVVHPSSDMRTQTTQPPRVPSAPIATSEPADTPLFNESIEDTSSSASQPLESPFLPDAKVDKRPLGGSEPTGTSSLPNELTAFSTFESSEGPKATLEEEPKETIAFPDPIDFASQLSKELEESKDEPAQLNEPDVEEPVEVPEPAEVSEQPELVEDTEPVEVAYDDSRNDEEVASDLASIEHETATPLIDESVPAGPASITQQYQEQPSSTQESGAIYDTESYHQPLVAPVKKKSGAWFILWIILLLALGAGVGAAVYFYVLPLI